MLEKETQPPSFETGSFEADSLLFLAKLQLSENQNMFCDYHYANYFFFLFVPFLFSFSHSFVVMKKLDI